MAVQNMHAKRAGVVYGIDMALKACTMVADELASKEDEVDGSSECDAVTLQS